MWRDGDIERRKSFAVLLVEALGDEFGEADVVHGGEELAVRHRYVSRKRERRRRRRCMFAGCLVAMKDLGEFELARDV